MIFGQLQLPFLLVFLNNKRGLINSNFSFGDRTTQKVRSLFV
ncbi:hypothetical protein M595_2107 [Lyngbya aestuarii BL J]|uniref:Uncharacterized protein n=1 Tax=Lyngbya aestuarii BL J TaxID=1348334 RepID=U7QLJ2_9CYAN|nr:hypothetical protein M595_2107 [Lyngbya aestuarii BL J]